jgi:hypothetical protein
MKVRAYDALPCGVFGRAWIALAVGACAAPIRPAPPPESLIPPAPALTLPRAPALAPPPASAAASVAPPAPLPEPDPGPIPTVSLELTYKLGEKPEPKTQAEYAAMIHELRHWNQGGTGALLAPLPGPEGHPDPRVIINVTKVTGPHGAPKIQQLLRRNHWIQVVRCYRLGAYKDSELRGWARGTAIVKKDGKIHDPRLVSTDLADKEVAECMLQRLTLAAMPTAAKKSQASVEIHVGPGDEPMPPPEELLIPGDGKLTLEAMDTAVRAGVPAFEDCYRAAFAYAPGLWGRMLVRFHLTERGKLDEAFEAGTHFPDERVSQCVLHAARKLRFPKPDGGEIRFVAALRFFSDRSAHKNETGKP